MLSIADGCHASFDFGVIEVGKVAVVNAVAQSHDVLLSGLVKDCCCRPSWQDQSSEAALLEAVFLVCQESCNRMEMRRSTKKDHWCERDGMPNGEP